MEIREKHNLFRLFFESFGVINRSVSAIIAYVIAAILGAAVLMGMIYLGVPRFLVSLVQSFYSTYLMVVFWRLLAAKADNNGESVSDSFASALFPAFRMIVFGFIYAAIAGVFAVGAFLLHKPLALGILGFLFFFVVFVRLSFAPLAIAVKEQGPISALIYSWELTGRNYFTTLFTLLIAFVFPYLAFGAILYGLYVNIPLLFASFDVLNPSLAWFAVGAGIVLFLLFVGLSMMAFLMLVFLNLDYGCNRDTFVPLPETKIANESTQVFGVDNNVLPANLGKPVRAEDVQGFSVKQASVQTGTDHASQEHLAQVYQKKAEEYVEYADEDRMPTILFDDDMAKQLEENRQMFAPKQPAHEEEHPNDDSDNSSIKMSK